MANVSGTTITSIVEAIADAVPQGFEIPQIAKSNWREELIVAYCVGKGKFSEGTDFTPQKQYINLQMDMYDLNGKWLGYQLGVHESTSTKQDLLNVPPMPTSMDSPPVQELPVKEWTKGVWTFADGSEIFAVGSAQSHLIPYKDGSFLFMVTTGQIITKGSGRYEGAYGTKQATGTAYVPPGLIQSGKFPSPGLDFDAKTIEVFRIVKAQDINPHPPRVPAGSSSTQSSSNVESKKSRRRRP